MRFKMMIFGLGILILGATQVSAQSIRFGLEVGANYSDWTGEDPNSIFDEANAKLGLTGGLFLQINLGPSFAIQPEILYSQKGTDFSFLGQEGTLDLSYVTIPLLFKVYLPTPTIKPNFFLGGSVAFNTVAKAFMDGEEVADYQDNINDMDYSVIGGVGVDIDKLSVSLRYEMGLTDLADDANYNLQNGTFTLLVGYSFI